MQRLTEENFLIVAMHSYDNPQCLDISEFERDIAKFTYVKKLLFKCKEKKDYDERLILNHLITLYNIFGTEATRMLFFKIEPELWGILITFLVYIKRMPDVVFEFGIKTKDYCPDETILERLRKL